LDTRVALGIDPRAAYQFGIYYAAQLASALHLPAITVVELGVAGGNGLVAMERIAAEVAVRFGLRIDVVGFDTGSGLPVPCDYRDLPHVWGTAYYEMDIEKLRGRLRHARIELGDVGATIPQMLADPALPPIGFVSFDLDYYSSTKRAFALFEGAAGTRLPRVLCYFDDLFWPEMAWHNPWVGETLAIREFNEEHAMRKISPVAFLRNMRLRPEPWHDQIFALHDFEHPLYNQNLSAVRQQLPLL
jgi:hypothetical protein